MMESNNIDDTDFSVGNAIYSHVFPSSQYASNSHRASHSAMQETPHPATNILVPPQFNSFYYPGVAHDPSRFPVYAPGVPGNHARYLPGHGHPASSQHRIDSSLTPPHNQQYVQCHGNWGHGGNKTPALATRSYHPLACGFRPLVVDGYTNARLPVCRWPSVSSPSASHFRPPHRSLQQLQGENVVVSLFWPPPCIMERPNPEVAGNGMLRKPVTLPPCEYHEPESSAAALRSQPRKTRSTVDRSQNRAGLQHQPIQNGDGHGQSPFTGLVLPESSRPDMPVPVHYIRWQDTKTPEPSGEKCDICNMDLSQSPEGDGYASVHLPPVAVLPCHHRFHDHCLQNITPADQIQNPPCIPCAVGCKG